MKQHKVKPGDCLASIAAEHGFGRWQDVYEHGANADLRAKRPDPNVLHPGDVVVIPDLRTRTVPAATGKRHVFVHKPPLRKLRIQLLDDAGLALARLPFSADDGRRMHSGQTDGDGFAEVDLAPTATTLKVNVLGWERSFAVGHLNPLDDTTDDDGVSGAQARLKGLGFDAGAADGKLGPRTKAALVAFQRAAGLELSGKLDAATRDALRQRFLI